MAGLLPIVTSFAEPKLHLGYRQIDLLARCLRARRAAWRGHEFHYALELEGEVRPCSAPAPRAARREEQGRRNGSVAGSFLHLIDRATAVAARPPSD